MGRPHRRPEKEFNGTLRIFTTLPAEMADNALYLYDHGYSPDEWIKKGIRTLIKEIDVVI